MVRGISRFARNDTGWGGNRCRGKIAKLEHLYYFIMEGDYEQAKSGICKGIDINPVGSGKLGRIEAGK